MSSENNHPQHSTPDSVLSSPVFSQCAWCRCRLDEESNPVGEPLPDLPEEASHGICTRCSAVFFPTKAARLRNSQA